MELIKTAKIFTSDRGGFYKPPAERVVFMVGEGLGTERAVSLVANFYRTVLHNKKMWSQKNVRNFDRVVQVFALPKQELPAFRKFMLEQGQAFVEAVDNYLTDRAVAKSGADTVFAGAHLYMYER